MRRLLSLLLSITLLAGCGLFSSEEEAVSEPEMVYENDGEIPENGEELFYEFMTTAMDAWMEEYAAWLDYDERYASSLHIQGNALASGVNGELDFTLESLVDRSDLTAPNAHLESRLKANATSFGQTLLDLEAAGQLTLLGTDLYLLPELLTLSESPDPGMQTAVEALQSSLGTWQHLNLDDLSTQIQATDPTAPNMKILPFFLYSYVPSIINMGKTFSTPNFVRDSYTVLEVLPVEKDMYRFRVQVQMNEELLASLFEIYETMGMPAEIQAEMRRSLEANMEQEILMAFDYDNPKYYSMKMTMQQPSPYHPDESITMEIYMALLEDSLQYTIDSEPMSFVAEAKKQGDAWAYDVSMEVKEDVIVTFSGSGEASKTKLDGSFDVKTGEEIVGSANMHFTEKDGVWSGDLFVQEGQAGEELFHVALHGLQWDTSGFGLSFSIETQFFTLNNILIEYQREAREEVTIEVPESHEELEL